MGVVGGGVRRRGGDKETRRGGARENNDKIIEISHIDSYNAMGASNGGLQCGGAMGDYNVGDNVGDNAGITMWATMRARYQIDRNLDW